MTLAMEDPNGFVPNPGARTMLYHGPVTFTLEFAGLPSFTFRAHWRIIYPIPDVVWHAPTPEPSGPVYSAPSASSVNRPHPHPNLGMGPPGHIQVDSDSSEPETHPEEGSQ